MVIFDVATSFIAGGVIGRVPDPEAAGPQFFALVPVYQGVECRHLDDAKYENHHKYHGGVLQR